MGVSAFPISNIQPPKIWENGQITTNSHPTKFDHYRYTSYIVELYNYKLTSSFRLRPCATSNKLLRDKTSYDCVTNWTVSPALNATTRLNTCSFRTRNCRSTRLFVWLAAKYNKKHAYYKAKNCW